MDASRPRQLDLGITFDQVQDAEGNAIVIPDDVSYAQRLQFALMIDATFNNFDGHRVVADLLRNRRLWQGAVMDRDPFLLPDDLGGELIIDFVKLRDIDQGWNVDTLYVLSSGADDAELLRLAATWHADQMDWITGDEASQRLGGKLGARIVRLWWD